MPWRCLRTAFHLRCWTAARYGGQNELPSAHETIDRENYFLQKLPQEELFSKRLTWDREAVVETFNSMNVYRVCTVCVGWRCELPIPLLGVLAVDATLTCGSDHLATGAIHGPGSACRRTALCCLDSQAVGNERDRKGGQCSQTEPYRCSQSHKTESPSSAL